MTFPRARCHLAFFAVNVAHEWIIPIILLPPFRFGRSCAPRIVRASRAVSDGHEPVSSPLVRRADAASRQIGHPDSIASTFQVRSNAGKP